MSEIIEPRTARETADALADANSRARLVSPRGGGSKADWGNPGARADIMLSMGAMNRVVEHAWADMTVTVEAGCTVARLQETLAQHGQRLAIDVLWPERATIGGVLATNDSGALRLRFGGLRDLIIGCTVALADGTIALSGGKVVKNVAGYDLPKLMTGSMGTLGVITQAVFRLHPIPHHTRTLSVAVDGPGAAQSLMLRIQDSQLAHSALQFRSDAGAVDVLLEGPEAGIAAQQSALSNMAPFAEGPASVWGARQDLWPAGDAAIAKFSVLPSRIHETLTQLRPERAVVQATGLGYARLTGDLAVARQKVEANGGSLVVLTPTHLDVWGQQGNALPLMRALKQQFDPNSILNRGRFVGGI